MGDSAKIEIDAASLAHYKQIAQGEEVRTSVKLLKQFIQINGKSPDKAKAEKLGKKMAAAFDTIPKEDIYRNELAAAAKAVANYVNGSSKIVGIPAASLHGLSGLAGIGSAAGLGRITGDNVIISLLRDAGIKDLTESSMKRAFRNAAAPSLCLELARLMMRRGELSMNVINRLTAKRKQTVLAGIEGNDITDLEILDWRLAGRRSGTNSMAGLGQVEVVKHSTPVPSHHLLLPNETISAKELAKMRFNAIGYNGRFKEVVGDPAIGFHMMVYGKPFQGKALL